MSFWVKVRTQGFRFTVQISFTVSCWLSWWRTWCRIPQSSRGDQPKGPVVSLPHINIQRLRRWQCVKKHGGLMEYNTCHYPGKGGMPIGRQWTPNASFASDGLRMYYIRMPRYKRGGWCHLNIDKRMEIWEQFTSKPQHLSAPLFHHLYVSDLIYLPKVKGDPRLSQKRMKNLLKPFLYHRLK